MKKKKNPSLIGNSKVKSLILGQSWKSEHTVAGGVLLQKMRFTLDANAGGRGRREHTATCIFLLWICDHVTVFTWKQTYVVSQTQIRKLSNTGLQ